jgi:predicted MFS family arabinose efflux permease
LYYADMGWSGAAFSLTLFSLGFVGIRLILANSLGRYGGLKVSLCCFLVEIIGLLMIGIGHTVMLVACGAFLTGSGFSLIFPSLGVEAVRRVPQQNQGTALGTYSAFLDLGLGITGPIAGVMISHCGFASLYLAAALVVFLAWLITWRLLSLAD